MRMKKLLTLTLFFCLFFTAGCGLKIKSTELQSENNLPTESQPQEMPKVIACTAEAKLCSDGSAVGRSGENCEFAPCPELNASATNTIIKTNTTNKKIDCMCPLWSQPSPSFCPNGTIVAGSNDDCGCPTPPHCVNTKPEIN